MSDDQMWVPPIATAAPMTTTMTGIGNPSLLVCTCAMPWDGASPPPQCRMHTPIGYVVSETASTPSPLSDADVDRIARRVRELQRRGE